jgi:S1-C subfamily serine protease
MGVRRGVVLACVGVGVALAGCSELDLGELTGTAGTPEAPSAPVGAAVAHPAAGGGAGAGLSAPEVYARVAPSIAFIETQLASGTGVLVAPGRVVTNAHVVWPHTAARVVFPDGTEVDPAPVIAQDLIADLAVIDITADGGTEPGAAPVAIADGSALPVGDEVYLIGYPSEVELFPQPAVTRGVLSRHRRWDAIDMPFVQTDADIGGGQSGGALVASDGTVVGFSSMIFGESDFGMAMSAVQAMDRVERMLAGEDVDGIDPRPLPAEGARRTQRVTLGAPWEQASFVLDAPYGTWVDVAVDSAADARLEALSPFGDVDLDVDDTRRGRESGEVLVQEHGPYFVVADLDRAGELVIDSSEAIVPLADPDDAATLRVGGRTVALMDFPGDADTFAVSLGRGQSVEVTVDTVNFSPDVLVYRADDPHLSAVVAEGTTGGALGMTVVAEVTAGEAGTYVIVVRDHAGTDIGAYFVSVDPAADG